MSIRMLLLIAVLAAAFSALAANAPIEQAMSPTDFQATGLNKLTAEELAKLNTWLASGSLQAAATAGESAISTVGSGTAAVSPTAVADNGPPITARARKERGEIEIKLVESRLIGTFSGWTKGTVFELENGQRWRVVEDRPYRADRKINPAVRIKKSVVAWLFKAEGINQPARVERIQ
jgi:hypothetical protein